MKFYVTEDYELIDPKGVFKDLSDEKQSDIMFTAMDIYEKNMGEAKGPFFLDVIVKPGSRKTSLGVVEQ